MEVTATAEGLRFSNL